VHGLLGGGGGWTVCGDLSGGKGRMFSNKMVDPKDSLGDRKGVSLKGLGHQCVKKVKGNLTGGRKENPKGYWVESRHQKKRFLQFGQGMDFKQEGNSS